VCQDVVGQGVVPTSSPARPPGRLHPGTPKIPARYGMTSVDTDSFINHMKTFPMFVKCVAKVVEDRRGSYDEDKQLGAYIMNAVSAVIV
jgi:hypothetical protein